MKTLKETIIEANRAYRLGRPIMSDQEFDDLCEDYEGQVSPEEYAALRNSLHEDSGKVKHPFMMGSLDKLKAEEPERVADFLLAEYGSAKTKTFSVSAKVDGISCRVHYNGFGEFESATTRGDGSFGIDCTEKVRHCVPAEICCDENVDIRGELVVTFKNFEEWFKPRGFKNPRNTCAGIVNQKECSPADMEHITFVPYEIMGGNFTKEEQFAALKRLGFTPAWNKALVITRDHIRLGEVVPTLKVLAETGFDYPTDGLVISAADYKQELDQYRPKHQKAFKLNTQEGWTVVTGVEWGKPSKDGRMTPVAELEGVEIAGSTITRVTLNNIEWMRSNDIRVGSRVLICKSGDVIPKIVAVDNEVPKTFNIRLPEICPVCGEKLTTRDDVDLCCPNEDCPSRKYEKVLTFITNLGIQHVSRQTLENWKLDSIARLIEFTPNPAYKMEVRFAKDLQDKMFGADETTIFKALSFTGLAEKTLAKIIEHYGYRELEAGGWKGPFTTFPEGVGAKTMEAFTACALENFTLTHSIINDSRRHGKMFSKDTPATPAAIKGSVCFTGALRTMSRGEASAKAAAAGYEVKSGVSKGLTYLVTNDPFSGSSKNEKAKKLGTKVITEDEFLALLS